MPVDKQSKANAVQQAQKAKPKKPVKNPDIYIDSTPSTRAPQQDKQEIQGLRNKFWEVRSPLNKI